MKRHSAQETALELFREHGGMLRTKQALEFGIHPLTCPPIRVFWFSGRAFSDGVPVGIYSPAKTVAGCIEGQESAPTQVEGPHLRAAT